MVESAMGYRGQDAWSSKRTGIRRFTALAAGFLILASGVGLAPGAAAAPNALDGLEGSGSPREPYLVEDATDLLAVATAIDTDASRYAGASYALAANVDMSGAGAFPGISTFTGTFDGRGHAISDIEYGPGLDGSSRLGMFRTTTGATVRNLTLSGVTAHSTSTTESDAVAGLVVKAIGSTISGVTLKDADLVALGVEKVAGLVAELRDGSTVTDSWVDGTITAKKMAGGVAAYSNNASSITNNLITVDLTVVSSGGASGTRGTDAAFVAAYPGDPSTGTFSSNVALSGSITYTGKVEGFTGRIVGYTGYSGWTATNNLANSAMKIDGSTVSGPGTKNQHGTDTDASALAQEST